MSKGKKSAAKSAPSQDVNWEQTLKEDKLNQDDWNPYVLFVESDGLLAEDHVAILSSVVSKGYRRKFGWIRRDDLLPQATIDLKQSQVAPSGGKKSKQASASSSQIPHVAVCEHAVTAAEQGTLTESLVAKLLKYRMLRMKSNELQKRNARLAPQTEAAKPKASASKKGGGKSAGKTKGKNTPAETESTVPVPSMPPSTMKKRGEEGDGPPPINDEPSDGPDYYYVLSGFSSLELFSELESLGIKANALCKVKAPDPQAVEAERLARKPISPLKPSVVEHSETNDVDLEEEARKKEQRQECLEKFWENIGYLVESTETGSMLRDMAQMGIDPPKALVPDKTDDKEQYGLEFFQKLASLVYGLLDSYDQYRRYLDYVQFLDLSPPTQSQDQEFFLTPTPSTTVLTIDRNTPSVAAAPVPKKGAPSTPDGPERRRYYNELLREIPQECTSIPIILFSMVEQVVCNIDGGDVVKSDSPVPSVVNSNVFTEFVSQLALPDDQKKNLMSEDDAVEEEKSIHTSPAVIPFHHIKRKSLPVDVIVAERRMYQLSVHSRVIKKPTMSHQEQCAVEAQFHALQHLVNAAELSPELLRASLLQLAFEHLPRSPSSSDPEQNKVKHVADLLESVTTISVDYPLDIELDDQETAPLSTETAVVVHVEQPSLSPGKTEAKSPCTPVLKLRCPQSSMVEYCVWEKLENDALLQLLCASSQSKPYLESYYHKLCDALLLVSHSGFSGDPVSSYTWEKQMLSPVGFNNYLEFVADAYGDEIDRVWSLDEERRIVEEEEWKKMVEEKLKERQAMEVVPEDTVKDGKKKSAKASADKKGKKGKETSAAKSAEVSQPVVEEFAFKRSTAFPGYRVGDKVLLYRSKVTTVHCPDQHQVKVFTTHPSGEGQGTHLSIMGDSAVLNMTMTSSNPLEKAVEELKTKLKAPPSQASTQQGDKTDNTVMKSESQDDEAVVEGSIKDTASEENSLLPPSEVVQACFSASLGEYVHFSVSRFGPSGDGSVPLPPEPDAKPTQPDTSDQGSRPSSRKSATPKKMSKKEQEAYQQQLNEQQKQLEKEQRELQEILMKEWRQKCVEITAAHQIQQLSLSASSGLHVQCQILPSKQADCPNQIVIRQSYPIKTAGSQQCERYRIQAHNKQSHVLYPDGMLCTIDTEGHCSILCPEGAIYRSPSTAEMKSFQTYLASKTATEERPKPSEEGTEAVGRTTSRVAFSGVEPGDGDDNGGNRVVAEEEDHVWVVSLPSGERYIWQKVGQSRQYRPPVQEVITEESTGQSEPLPGEDRETPTCSEVVMPLPPLGVNGSVDPVTKEEMLVREDGVVIVRHPSGTVIVDHPNSARFTTQYMPGGDNAVESVTVECIGFARVQYSHPAGTAKITLPNSATVSCSTDGTYTITKEDGGSVLLTKDGIARYQTDHCAYLVNYGLGKEEDTLFKCLQQGRDENVLFSVARMGDVTLHSDMLVSPDQHLPDYYLLDGKDSAYRLLSTSQLDEVLKQPATNRKAILQDIFPGDPMQKSITVLQPDNSSSPHYHIVPFMKEDIIPPNLKKASTPGQHHAPFDKKPRFGVSVGKGLMIGSLVPPCPPKPIPPVDALVYRQFTAPYQDPGKLRTACTTFLTKYISWKTAGEKDVEELQPSDVRSDEEKEKVTQIMEQVKEELNHADASLLSGDKAGDSLWKAYVKQLRGPSEDERSQENVSVQRRKEYKVDAMEKEEAEEAKKALRSGGIPNYFDSEKGKAFLSMQSPDMQVLSLKLAQPKLTQSYKAKVSFEDHYVSKSPPGDRGGSGFTTPSTTCSTTVPMGETSSPSPSELGQMTSPLTLRPQNPTPSHADGNGTPTESRPLNPTPGHASRDTMTLHVSGNEKNRPTNPTSMLTFTSSNGQNDHLQTNFAISERLEDYNEVPYEGESPVADTIAALDQEETVAGSEGNQFESKDLDEVDPPKRINNSTYFTVTGERRKTEVPIPESLLGSRPGEIPNKHFTSVEEPVRRKVMTSSVAKPLTAGVRTMPEMRGFELYPKEVAFGVLKEGCVYGCTVTIKNIGVDSCRYKIKQPPPSTGLKVRYTPGSLAAGLKSTFDIEIYAMAVGAIGDSGIGAIRHVLEIVTETSHLHLPITAIILTQTAYEKRLPIHPQGKHSLDVKLLSERPTSRERIDRPTSRERTDRPTKEDIRS